MKKTAAIKKIELFLMSNRGLYKELGPVKIAGILKVNPAQVRKAATLLRKRGVDIPRLKSKSFNTKGKREDVEEAVKKSFGEKPTKEIAMKLGVSASFVRQVASYLEIPFTSHQGNYNMKELAKLLGVRQEIVANWTRNGLEVSYEIAGGGPYKIKVIDLDELRKFLLEGAPEILAGLLKKISPENKIILELSDLSSGYKEKLLHCKKCKEDFWDDISIVHPRCPRCGRVVSKFSPKKVYR